MTGGEGRRTSVVWPRGSSKSALTSLELGPRTSSDDPGLRVSLLVEKCKSHSLVTY